MAEEFKPENTMWSEKYRPRYIKDMVGSFKEKILKYLQSPQSVPHFLLYSRSPGTGKTTLAKAIINELGCDSLMINSSDDRKLDVIRDKVKEFSVTQSSTPGLKRCVFLDEVDGMWGPAKASQDALRNVMETYARNTFFILTANNINKVIEPLQSRCVKISFAYPNKTEVKAYLEGICRKEQMEYTDEALAKLVDLNHPSIRNSVLVLQDLYTQGLPVTNDTVHPVNKLFEDLWVDFRKNLDWKKLRDYIVGSTVDPRELNTYFWSKAIQEENISLKLIQILCRNERDMALGSDSKVILATSIIELTKAR